MIYKYMLICNRSIDDKIHLPTQEPRGFVLGALPIWRTRWTVHSYTEQDGKGNVMQYFGETDTPARSANDMER